MIVPYHRIYKLDTIVLGRIMARSNHQANGLAIEFPRTEGCEKTDTKDDGIEEIASWRGMLVKCRY
jgi:hypothetical protein